MDPERWARVRKLFEAALDVVPAERQAWLEAACAGDRSLFEEVARLLATDASGGDHPLLRPEGALATLPAAQLVGRRLGAYTLVRWIGAGGMGAVYEAIEDHPHRRVAIKTLGMGLSSERARRRFEDEVEILARLRHPHIAQILGAGTWREQGLELPWFAMELVEDPRPLDRHAREEALSLAATVTLLRQVCEAMHFAHQRGVIHRDLKPANILVDRTGAPKIIDFGIARVAGEELSAQRTATGEILGTLAYMSPERLTGGASAADTGSDLYSLGVILYELLAGQPPHALDQLPPAQAVDLVREQDPPPPSAAAQRFLVPPELDWIVLKAMARDRALRYASAAELAADLDRFLRDEPVAAGPPSTAYRLRKLVRRHRVALALAMACLVVLVAGAVVATAGWIRASQAEQLAEQRRKLAERHATTLAQVNRLQREILSASYVDAGGRDVRLADLLDAAVAGIDTTPVPDADVEVGLRTAIGISYLGLGLLADADRQFQRGLDLVKARGLDPLAPTTIALTNNLGMLREQQGQLQAAEQALRTTLAGKRAVWGEEHEETASTQINLTSVLAKLGKHAEVLELAAPAWRTMARLRGEGSPAAVLARNAMAAACSAVGRNEEADTTFAALVELARSKLGPDHAATNAVRSAQAGHFWKCGRKAEYAAVTRAILESHSRKLGDAHPNTLIALNNLAAVLLDGGDLDGAEAMFRRVVAARERAGLQTGFEGIMARQNLAFVLRRQKKLDEAEALVAKLRAEAEHDLPRGHWLAAMLLKEAGACLRDRGQFADAEEPLRKAATALERLLGAKDFRTLKAIKEVVALYEAWGRADAAAEWSARIGRAEKEK